MADVSQMFKGALMKGNPGITMQKADQVWAQISTNPAIAQTPPQQLVMMGYKIAAAMAKQSQMHPKPGFATGGLVDGAQPDLSQEGTAAPVLPTVQVSAPRMSGTSLPDTPPNINVPGNYLSPEELAQQHALLGTNVTNTIANARGALGSQLLDDAQKKYQDYLNNNAGNRQVSNILAGSVAGSSGGQSVTNNQNAWKATDDLAQQGVTNAINIQKTLLDQYKTGVESNKQLLSDLKDNANFQISASASKLAQVETQAKLVPILQDANNRLTWTDLNSPQTQAIQDTAAKTLNDMGFSMDYINSHIAGKTGLEVYTIMAGVKGAQDLLKTAADTAKVSAEVPGTQATSAITQAAAKSKIGPDGKLISAPGEVTTVSAGPVSITNPKAAVESTGAGQATTEAAKQFKIYDTTTKPAIQDAVKYLDKTYTGKGALAKSSLDPFNNDQQMVASLIAQVYSSYPDAIDPAVGNTIKSQMSQPGWNGVPKLSLSPEQNILLLKKAMLNVERAKQYTTNQNDFVQKGGNPTQFYKEPGANVSGTVTMTRGGKTFEIPADKVDAATKAGMTRK